MSEQIDVEKNVFYLDEQKLWSISLRTTNPYGKFYPRSIYITAIFNKNLDKALKMAWDEFYKSKKYQDNYDKSHESRQSTVVRVTV